MANCCDKIGSCSDVCNCLHFVSPDNSIQIVKSGCNFTFQTLSGNQTPWVGSSNSLVITPGGTLGHSPNIEIVPSTDLGNVFVLGSDGHPYVQGVNVIPGQCISIVKTIVNGIATYQPVLDMQCIANIVCGLCNAPCNCAEPTGFAVTFDGRGTGNADLYRVRAIWQPVVGATGYTLEYKLCSSGTWTTISVNQPTTSNSSLVVNLPGAQECYDFRVKAICGSCESPYVLLNNQLLVECTAPFGAVFDPVALTITWFAAPNQPTSSFELLIRRDDQGAFSLVSVPVAEIPVGSGTYVADFSGYPFTPDYVYHFCISNICGATQNVLSDHGSGCAFDCVVPAQSVPIATNITTTDADINWTNIVGVNAHTIKVVDNTTATTVIPTTNIGFVNTYHLSGLVAGHQYTVTIGYICGSLGGCVGRDVVFTTTAAPLTCVVPINLIIT